MDDHHAALQRRLHDEHTVARRRFDVDALIGVTEDDARRRVVGAGGHLEAFEAADPDIIMTADLRLDRVRAYVRDGRVVRADVG